jgi:hypothetical protein
MSYHTPPRGSRLASQLFRVVSVALVLLPVAALSTPANAAIIERGTFDDTGSFTFDDCGFSVAVDERFVGWYTIGQGTPQTGGEFFRVHQKTTYTGTFTNVETGAYFTSAWHTNFREMPATIVDEDGPVVTYQTKDSGVWDTIRDSTGTVRYRSAGTLVFQYVFDTGGDGAPGGGEFLSEEFIRTSGNWQTFDADFCAIVDELIG